MALTLFLLGCILVLAHTAETILGFGCTLIALALGVYLLPLETLVPMLVILGLLQSIWLVARWYRHIDWRTLLLQILPLAVVGMVIGISSRGVADESTLKMVLGAFIIVISLAELAMIFIKRAPAGQLRWYYRIPLLTGGGIFHGLFATGGPPIVYYASRQFQKQEDFRATLSTLWLFLNVGLIIGFILGGQMDLNKLGMAAMVLPGMILGIIIGSLIRVKELWFKILTYILLFFAGLFLLVQL
ncbi:MAG: sulfite exporter TauE/SafE family protein [Chloroflexi bacterium]|nr:sulfite exporter TauE/SafE family protein [Chloroflexota bacterium]MBM4453213.1 sulfite exporter TauE/SafE family protein [Chloroflexota bacterium]